MVAADRAPTITRYRAPQLAYPRHVAWRALRPAGLWGAAIGLFIAASALGYSGLAPTPAQRNAVLDTLASNVGFKALLGDTGRLHTVSGFVDWRVIGVMSLATSVWALLASTRQLRGEEAAGRWEITLSGPTDAAAQTRRVLAALGAALLLLYVVVTAVTLAVAGDSKVGFAAGRVFLFGLVVIAGPAQFVAVGAVASQLAATRARAVGLAAAVFAAAFLLRALGDSAHGAHWLVYASPLGWIEQIRPLDDPHPLWLVPIAAITSIGAATAAGLAGRRDLGASILPDHDHAVARTHLLGGPTLLALRLSRRTIAAWVAGIAAAALLYGAFARAAGEAFAQSAAVRRLPGVAASTTHVGAQLYASVVFLMVTTALMLYAASAAASIRDTEADGHLDNLLVRQVGRVRWLAGRLAIVAGVIVIGGMLAGAAFWAGSATQRAGLDPADLVKAGLNATAAPLLLLGMSTATLGVRPRATAAGGYTLVAWSFLLEMLGSVININHWLMDTSLLHHIALAPAVDPIWRVAAIYLGLGLTLAALGAWRLAVRDIELS